MRIKKLWFSIIAAFLLLMSAGLSVYEPEQSPEPIPTFSSEAIEIVAPTFVETPSPIKEDAAVLEEIPVMSTSVPETAEPLETVSFCTLTVRCDDILQNMDKLTSGKEILVPEDGMIFPRQQISFTPGESVFDILYRSMKERGIHMEYVRMPIYNSVYVEGIGNLYEFDCGDTSGWTYTVNGESPMHGSSQHLVEKDDNIEFVYKCSIY